MVSQRLVSRASEFIFIPILRQILDTESRFLGMCQDRCVNGIFTPVLPGKQPEAQREARGA